MNEIPDLKEFGCRHFWGVVFKNNEYQKLEKLKECPCIPTVLKNGIDDMLKKLGKKPILKGNDHVVSCAYPVDALMAFQTDSENENSSPSLLGCEDSDLPEGCYLVIRTATSKKARENADEIVKAVFGSPDKRGYYSMNRHPQGKKQSEFKQWILDVDSINERCWLRLREQ